MYGDKKTGFIADTCIDGIEVELITPERSRAGDYILCEFRSCCCGSVVCRFTKRGQHVIVHWFAPATT